eukprot:CAMPEP_0180117266 /NCGR_PEP_ID=MMETSP0986-20121125/829_1 /TAXON_ID=697907 /ORGANISM="non described non described, Strain CCMP2293" /LENGTH=187 /DNA_ID=CAMNT_0022056133 /DNA_START=61 /DNA_END=621 /DNA_ORIENTATION=+
MTLLTATPAESAPRKIRLALAVEAEVPDRLAPQRDVPVVVAVGVLVEKTRQVDYRLMFDERALVEVRAAQRPYRNRNFPQDVVLPAVRLAIERGFERADNLADCPTRNQNRPLGMVSDEIACRERCAHRVELRLAQTASILRRVLRPTSLSEREKITLTAAFLTIWGIVMERSIIIRNSSTPVPRTA